MRTYFAEFIGTFALVFFGTGALVVSQTIPGVIDHTAVALSFGLVVMCMIYAFGEVSGAHINPAVTVAFWAAKLFPKKHALPYILSQILGAILASLTLSMMFPGCEDLGVTAPSNTVLQAVIVEFFLTYFLMLVIINVSTGSKEVGTMAAIAIGGIVALEALVFGPISGASMNPARSIGPALISGNLSALWIYLFAPVLGALLAVWTCSLYKGKNCC